MLSTPPLLPIDPVLCASQAAKSKLEHDLEEYFRPDPPGKSVWDVVTQVGGGAGVEKRDSTLGPEFKFE